MKRQEAKIELQPQMQPKSSNRTARQNESFDDMFGMAPPIQQLITDNQARNRDKTEVNQPRVRPKKDKIQAKPNKEKPQAPGNDQSPVEDVQDQKKKSLAAQLREIFSKKKIFLVCSIAIQSIFMAVDQCISLAQFNNRAGLDN